MLILDQQNLDLKRLINIQKCPSSTKLDHCALLCTHILIILAAIWLQRATSVKKWMRACFRTWRTFFGKGEIKAKIATLLAKLS